MLLRYIDREVKQIRREWQTSRRKIAKQISPSQRSILAELDDIFFNATTKLLADLQSPTLTIVTTGTTSSGKSTLVNLLCGAEIIPVAVQEMSAGLVSIEYSQTTALHIDRTPGALWECGDWYNISDREIYDRLTGVMNSYLEAKYNDSIDISYPQIRIEYPIRLLAKDSRLQLPEGIRLRIVDLPGLSHQEDIENLSLLKTCNSPLERLRQRALFLVTYNSAETDRQKVNILLEGVVEQLKIIGGLSKNMWFIFNRIDVFHSDRDRVASEEKFVDRTRSKIDKLLIKHHLQIEPKQVAKISTMPALLSLLIRSKDENERIEAASRLDRNFNFLIPENIANDLPRNSAKWSLPECEQVSAAIWDVSYGAEFDRLLIDSIQTNLTDLIFLPIIQEFEQGVCLEISKWAHKISERDIIESTIINYVKTQSDRLQSRLDRAVKISIKFKRSPQLLKQIIIYYSLWIDRLSSIWSKLST